MSTLRLNDKKIRPVATLATGLFICACAAIFLPLEMPHKIVLAVGTLAVFSLWLCPWQISLALLLSVIGDYCGSCNWFIGQMGTFAAAHILYMIYFVRRYLTRVERDRKLTMKAKGYLAMVCFCIAGLLATCLFKIAPQAPGGIIRTGLILYTIIISAMLVMALLQRSSLFALGAVLFVFSDFILAWNKFLTPVPYSSHIILITYFLAQWLLFIRATPLRIAPGMRMLRF